jgi:hypothetical protein
MPLPVCLPRGEIGSCVTVPTSGRSGKLRIDVAHSTSLSTSRSRVSLRRPAVAIVEPATRVAEDVETLLELSTQRSNLEAAFYRDYQSPQLGSNLIGMSDNEEPRDGAPGLPLMLRLPSPQKVNFLACEQQKDYPRHAAKP